MRRSIATVSLSGTLPEKLEAISAARFDGVEIFENDLTFYAGTPRQIRTMASDLGLSIDLFQPFREFEGVSEAQFQANLLRAEKKFDLMGELGVNLILVCSNVSPTAINDDDLAAAQLHALAERAAKHGIKVGFEALAWGQNINRFDHAWKIVEKADHPHLGLIIDSFHTLALPYDWSGLKDLPGERIFFMQIADAPRLDMATLMLSRHYRCLPGQGELDVSGFVAAALEAGYTGTMSLEIFNDSHRSAPPRQTAKDAMRSLLYVEEGVRFADAKKPSARPRRVGLFDPPSPARLDGIAFVEFTVDEPARNRLTQLLTRLGFVRLGKHRSKDVTLYGQGDIRIVINAEQESVAHSYFLLHGPSVCALAFEVDDPQAALGRAEAFGSTRFEGRVGPNERSIPAIRSLDGLLIYFNERDAAGRLTFENDFLADEPVANAPTLCKRIDHIAQALPEGSLDATILFYRSLLGLKPETTLVLADPYGLVRSRAMSNDTRKVRFPLNIADGRKTSTAQSVSNFSGAGVHHIALETDDIFAAARELARLGAPILSIPSNYFDDLAARFALTDTRIDELRDLNILYDKTEQGEFYHLYTTPFDGRFFFEIVQRVDGYDQYGAPNAPVRMAALAQMRSKTDTDLLVR